MKRIQAILPNNYTSLLQWMSYIWAGTICFPFLQGSFYGVFALLLWGIIKGYLGFSIRDKSAESFWKSKKTPFYFLLAYLLWMTTTIFWSEDIHEYFRQFEKLIPLYLLAFIGFMQGIEKHLNVSKVLNAFLGGVLIGIGYMVVRMGLDLFIGDTIGGIKNSGFGNFDILSYLSHRSYVGVTLLMAMPVALSVLDKKILINKVSISLLALFLVILCLTSSARVLMVLVVIVFGYIFYFHIGKKISLLFKVLIIAVFLSGVTIVLLKNTRINHTIYLLKNNINKDSSRANIWSNALEMGKKKPLVGYGLGDVKGELLDMYDAKGYMLASTREFNTHNQYLQILLSGGGISLLLLLLFFISVYVMIKQNGWSLIGISFIIIYTVVFSVESVLARNIGVFPLVFWVIIFQITNTVSDSGLNRKHSRALAHFVSAILVLFVGINVSSYYMPLISSWPRTYIRENFEVVKHSDLPDYNLLPESFSGAQIVLPSSQEHISVYYNSLYSKVETINYDNDSVVVSFSLWCYVEDNSDIERVCITLSDGSVYKASSYDLKKSGEWQQLAINHSGRLEKTQFYNVVFRNRIDTVTSGIYFYNPQIKQEKVSE